MEDKARRRSDQLRPIEFVRNFTKHAAGSVPLKCGDTFSGKSLDALLSLARKGLKRIFAMTGTTTAIFPGGERRRGDEG